MIEVRQTTEYAKWFKKLRNHRAKSRINVRIRRIFLGNLGDIKSVGGSVSELRIPYGPGYRLYITKQGETVIILLCGGDKSTQRRDIELAHKLAKEL